MLEILLLIYLGKRLGAMLRAKGRPAGWFQFLLVVAWFGGEFLFAIAFVVMSGDPDMDAGIYLGALVGAAGGATIVFAIAHSLAPRDARRFSAFEVIAPVGSRQPPPAPPV